MMRLRTTPTSPFGRKVKMVAMICGLANELQVEFANTSDPNDHLREQNPLGKIPVLVLDKGVYVYDSHVICEFLDSLHHKQKLFPSGVLRWEALTLAALADGIMEAALLKVYEHKYRPEHKQHDKWLEYQKEKINRALNHLETHIPITDSIHIGHITLACALGYLDFRFMGEWREGRTHLVKWLEMFDKKVPAYNATRLREA